MLLAPPKRHYAAATPLPSFFPKECHYAPLLFSLHASRLSHAMLTSTQPSGGTDSTPLYLMHGLTLLTTAHQSQVGWRAGFRPGRDKRVPEVRTTIGCSGVPPVPLYTKLISAELTLEPPSHSFLKRPWPQHNAKMKLAALESIDM